MRVDVSFISFNREYGLWTMSTVHFIFHRGGLINKGSSQRSLWLKMYHGHGSSNRNSDSSGLGGWDFGVFEFLGESINKTLFGGEEVGWDSLLLCDCLWLEIATWC